MSTNPNLQNTAFNTPKQQTDTSEISGIFTYDIPNKKFRIVEKIGAVVTHYENTSSALYASSQSSELSIRAGSIIGDITVVYTRLHPKLHANRGKIFANSMFVDSWAIDGAEIETGIFDIDETTLDIINGMTFLYANRKVYCRVYADGVIMNSDDPPLEDQLLEDIGLNPIKGHLCDIQAQWRGVGDIRFYLSELLSRASKNIYIFKALNAMDNLTTPNPSLHAGYIARNNGGVPHGRSGCFDVSSETFDQNTYEPLTFANNADINTSSTGTVLYALKIPFTFNGKLLTRDSLLLEVITSSVARSRYKIWHLYKDTRLTKTVTGVPLQPLVDADWTARTDGSATVFIDNSGTAKITGFDKTGLTPLYPGIVSAGLSDLADFDHDDSPLFLTHGDVIVVEGYGNNADMSTLIVVGEEM